MSNLPASQRPAHAGQLAEVFDLVGPLYRQAHRRVERDTAQAGLSVGVRAILAMLWTHGPMTVPDMARAQMLSRQFAQRMVNEAMAQGLAEQLPNPAHRRSWLIQLTTDGSSLVSQVLDRERAVLREAERDLTAAEVEGCLRVLRRLLDLLGDEE